VLLEEEFELLPGPLHQVVDVIKLMLLQELGEFPVRESGLLRLDLHLRSTFIAGRPQALLRERENSEIAEGLLLLFL